MKRNTAASQTRETHKSRKTTPASVSDSGPSSTALTTTPPSVLPDNPIAGIVTNKPDTGTATAPTVPGVSVLPLADADPKNEWWHRPADSKARKKSEKIVVLRAAGHPDKEIAKRLKTTEGTVRQLMYIARKNGWLDDEDEPVDLEAELALTIDRKIVRNIGATLDGQMTNWQTHEMTIAAAKGRGVFKSDKNVAPEGNGMSVVAIQVIMPPIGAGDQMPQVDESQMGGVPAYVDGEIAHVDTRPALPAGHPLTEPEDEVGAVAQRPLVPAGFED